MWVTRAQPGAARTAARLITLGFEPVVLPLLAIEPLSSTLDLTGVDALVFTSPNGVAAFVAHETDRGLPVLTVGAATADAARAAGFNPVRSADGDLQTLVTMIRADPALIGARLLHPAAETPAGDLAAALEGHAAVTTAPAYRAVETGAAPPEGFDAVLIHSPRAAHALVATLPRGEAAGRICLAISPAAAEPLAALPFARIAVAARPDEHDLLSLLGKPPGRV